MKKLIAGIALATLCLAGHGYAQDKSAAPTAAPTAAPAAPTGTTGKVATMPETATAKAPIVAARR